MKNSNFCIKCQGESIVSLVADKGLKGVKGSFDILTVDGFMGFATIVKFACLDCGYMESWLNTEEDIEKVRKCFGKTETA